MKFKSRGRRAAFSLLEDFASVISGALNSRFLPDTMAMEERVALTQFDGLGDEARR